jgi:flagellar hook-associated protein FlgK
MGLSHSPSIVLDGLVLCLDAGNPKSYPGSGTTWTDLSGSGYDFTMTNGATTNATNGGVFSFDGSDDYLNTTSIPSTFWNSGSWTVSLWAYFDTVNKGTDNGMVGHGTASANNGLHLGERNRRIYFGFYSNDLQSDAVLNATTWYNIVWRFAFGTKQKRIFLNGVQLASGGTVGYSGNTADTRIGNYTYTATTDMDGFLSNIMFYNKVLTDDEIQQNYNALKGRFSI